MMQTNANTDEGAIGTAQTVVVVHGERNMMADTAVPGIAGACAALETFYYAFNTRSLDLLRRIWAEDPLVQLNTPVVGLVRGSTAIAALYERMVSGPERIQSALEDIVEYVAPDMVVFTGREHGTYTRDRERDTIPERPEIRTICICIFRFILEQGGWRQVYHHVSLDDADQLARFQRAARRA